MMPGIPPTNPMLPNRRQNDYQYGYPPQAYNQYYPPQHYHPHPHAPPHPQQWYQPYPQQQYVQQAPRHYQPPPLPQQQHAPIIVSSHPHPHQYQPPPMVLRPNIPTPPLPYSQTPPQALPSTPSVVSVAQASSEHSVRSESIATPPPSSSASRPSTAADVSPPQLVVADLPKAPFEPPLPWLSRPQEPFPPARRRRPRKARQSQDAKTPLELPSREQEEVDSEKDEVLEAGDVTEEHTESQASTVAAPSDQGTPATSQAPSEIDSEQPVTASSAPTALPASAPAHARSATRPVVPIIPKIPMTAAPKASSVSQPPESEKDASLPAAPADFPPSDTAQSSDAAVPDSTPQPEGAAAVKVAPKSWADLVRTKASASSLTAAASVNGIQFGSGMGTKKPSSLAEAIRAFSVDPSSKFSFLKPRGLVNTGNMCYMNSVLQILVFCIPFYEFLDLVGKRAAHSFKSDTPLLDAMILFMREFPIIDSATSVEQLKRRLKMDELEQYGEPFTPENVYDAIKRLPRFATMRRGHQQDAEEFLIFLLEALHDECVKAINSIPISAIDSLAPVSPISERSSVTDAGWQEVGPKQKASTTHSSGDSLNETPITKIFGGSIRSELRVPGKKPSVTTQPYQPLQLDIGAPEVHNIVDALKGLTRSETIHGDFQSPRGPDVAATKQIFVETLPPVLILHLKRFEYNNTGGTQKIWKKVGYPLELTIPKEVFPQQKRAQMALSGLPKYRLTGVIYHHGKNATSGHYTVDVRRQEGHEWIRMDDTVIRRVRSEDVAEGGAEEDPKVLAKALEEHKKDSTTSKNLFDQFGAVEEDEDQPETGWNTAGNTKDASAKKWSSVANGVATPSSAGAKTPTSNKKENVKDSKVAYILFYRRI